MKLALLIVFAFGVSGCGWKNIGRSTEREHKEVTEWLRKNRFPQESKETVSGSSAPKAEQEGPAVAGSGN